MCAAFFDLQAAQGHAHAAGAVGQRIGLAAGAAGVDRLGSAQLLDAAFPQRGVLHLRLGQMAQHLRAHRVGIAVGQGVVGVVALHLGLPVAFKGRQNLLVSGAAQHCNGHCRTSLSNEDNGKRGWRDSMARMRGFCRRIAASSLPYSVEWSGKGGFRSCCTPLAEDAGRRHRQCQRIVGAKSGLEPGIT